MKYATYIRVSTQKQGRSGLGLESQQKICGDYIKAQGGVVDAEFKDVESGTHRTRRGLLAAIDYCKKNDCTLVIAKLDRLARDVEFCFKVVNTGIDIHFCDMPNINTLLLGVFASVAQYERELTSDRTKKALAAKKARGEKVGGATNEWRISYDNKNEKEKTEWQMKKGRTKRARHQDSRDMAAFERVIRSTFPDATKNDDPSKWDWAAINCKEPNKSRMLTQMRDHAELDESGKLFLGWDFSDCEGNNATAQKLRSYMYSFRRSYTA